MAAEQAALGAHQLVQSPLYWCSMKCSFGYPASLKCALLVESIICSNRRHIIYPTLHRLKKQKIARDVFMDQVKSEQWMAQMIENAHEDYEIKAFAECCHVVNGKLAELDLNAAHLCGEACLGEIAIVEIDP